MIEKVLILIIQELGPVGLLVVGLYFILYKPMKEMAYSIRCMNNNMQRITTILQMATWENLTEEQKAIWQK